ncbi:hypothetical protein THEYE_A0055 [Thermodesulfovibrio yellowstonii DSM 11347]|uniref:Uncharacterized protein n=1 Tax=Thermodesulfovibrio yellowstonii (strain ATCC 51303 / DSM 11347 / YP87) TaxID=289376 RepID=B5YGX9_THEYD|nr:hypothetical protein THEYE_A0055 [Thermodesulfovibrio yellowstonii DSM 11347]
MPIFPKCFQNVSKIVFHVQINVNLENIKNKGIGEYFLPA